MVLGVPGAGSDAADQPVLVVLTAGQPGHLGGAGRLLHALHRLPHSPQGHRVSLDQSRSVRAEGEIEKSPNKSVLCL